MESNVVFAGVRYNWELSRDGFIVRGAPCASPFFPETLLLICQNIDLLERTFLSAATRDAINWSRRCGVKHSLLQIIAIITIITGSFLIITSIITAELIAILIVILRKSN